MCCSVNPDFCKGRGMKMIGEENDWRGCLGGKWFCASRGISIMDSGPQDENSTDVEFSFWETRGQYLLRLRRTAMRLPPKFTNKSIMNLKVWSQRLYDAKGGHIAEGK